MIIIDGIEYRNLEEQVLKNKEDIAELKASTPDVPTEGVTETRVNELISAAAIKRDGTNAPTTDISWNDKGIVELGFIELDEKTTKPSDNTDIYKDSASNVHITHPIMAEYGLNSGGLPLTNVGSPTNNTDAATKKYVDDAIADIPTGGGGGSGSGGFTWTEVSIGGYNPTTTGWYETGVLTDIGVISAMRYNNDLQIFQFIWTPSSPISTDAYGDKYMEIHWNGTSPLPLGSFLFGSANTQKENTGVSVNLPIRAHNYEEYMLLQVGDGTVLNLIDTLYITLYYFG